MINENNSINETNDRVRLIVRILSTSLNIAETKSYLSILLLRTMVNQFAQIQEKHGHKKN